MPEALRVLLIEDDASIRRFVAMALEDESLQLAMAASLGEARALLGSGEIDVVIADLMLGDGNGLDLLAELGPRAGLTRIAFSAGIDRTTRARLDAIGVTEVLSKPVSLAALQETVARARVAASGAIPSTRAAVLARPGTALETAAVERYFGGERTLYEIYRQQCLAQFAEDLRQGNEVAAGSDAPAMRRLAHSLKSVLTMLGHEPAAARARMMEEAAADADAARAAALWQDLAATLQALRAAGDDDAR